MMDLVARYRDLEGRVEALRAERDALIRACIVHVPAYRGHGLDQPEYWRVLIPRKEGTQIWVGYHMAMTEAEAFAAVRRAAGLTEEPPS